MAEITVRGKTARWLWSNVQGCTHLLEDSRAVLDLVEEDRYQTELRLMAFLKAMLYGEGGDLRGTRFEGSYFNHLEAFENIGGPRRGFSRLYSGRKPIVVKILLGRRTRIRLDLGYAEGVTTVVPLSEVGYRAYLAGQFHNIHVLEHPEQIAPPYEPDRPYPSPVYLYIGTMLHVPGLLHHQVGKAANEVELSPDTPKATRPLIAALFRHMAGFMPHLRLDHSDRIDFSARGPVVPNAPHGSLPKLCCSVGSELGLRLISGCGFKPTPGRGRYPSYLLDLDELNNPVDVTLRESKRLGRARAKVRTYLEVLARYEAMGHLAN